MACRRALSTLQPRPGFRSGAERTAWLRQRLERPEILVMPCAYDGLTAGLVEKADFETTFVSGFSVSASRGFPDCQLVSYAEMLEAARSACAATRHIPVMCDGDTGYGNAMNVHRTVAGYAHDDNPYMSEREFLDSTIELGFSIRISLGVFRTHIQPGGCRFQFRERYVSG